MRAIASLSSSSFSLALTALVVAGMAACAPPSKTGIGGGGSGDGSGGGGGSGVSDKTDYTRCTGAPPAGASILGDWQSIGAFPDGSTYETTMTIANTAVSFINVCKSQAQDLTAIAALSVPSLIHPHALEVTKSGRNVGKSGTLTCVVAATHGSYAYALQGDCLKLTGPSARTYVRRAN